MRTGIGHILARRRSFQLELKLELDLELDGAESIGPQWDESMGHMAIGIWSAPANPSLPSP